MIETLSLLAPPQNELIELNGLWHVMPAHNAEGVELGYAEPDFDDSSWETVRLPHLRHSTAERDTLWYRYTFQTPSVLLSTPQRSGEGKTLGVSSSHERIILRFGGSFYRTHVWLNGIDLGAHEGYFQPFGFDVTDLMRDGENVIAVRCRFPVEAGSFKRKTSIAGVFADWDCKPYPSSLYPNLPAPNEWTVPIGLWQPVSLMKCGAVLVETFNVFPTLTPIPDPSPALQGKGVPSPVHEVNGGGLGWGRNANLKIVLTLHNLTPESQQTHLRLDIRPHNSDNALMSLRAKRGVSGTMSEIPRRTPSTARGPFASPRSAQDAPRNDIGQSSVAHYEMPLTLAPHESRHVEFEIEMPNARLWFPHTHGEPFLYQAQLNLVAQDAILRHNTTSTLSGAHEVREVEARPERSRKEDGAAESPASFDFATDTTPSLRSGRLIPDRVERIFGVRAIEAIIESDRWEWRLNQRRIFPKGSNYISDFYLDRVSADGLKRDVQLAREANLDLLRVHAHIAPLDFYRLCDEMGVMVMCDFPLIWTYAVDLLPDEDRAFRESVQRQVAEMIQLLGSHPSIVLWSMHNEPPWTPDGSFLGSDLHEAKTNQQMDRESVEIARSLDSSRPVIAASGESDQHLYHGWYTGSWRDNHDLHPRFPTEFGVQALPNLDSPFWATVNRQWPIEADDTSWAHAGYQPVFWASPGVGSPSQFSSLADYVKQSQAYQAFFIRYTIDQWRRQKFNPLGGYIHFLFTDGWSAITWSVLDYYRLPKAGYDALKESSSAVRVCFDLHHNFNVEHGFHIVYRRGDVLKCDLYLVNDDYRARGKVEVRWWLARRDRRFQKLINAIRSVFAKRMVIDLPDAAEGARLIASIETTLRGDGDYTLWVEVRRRDVPTERLNRNHIDFRVGAERSRAKSVRRVPSLLLNKVYQVGSLRHTENGFTFTLRNPTMPVALERLSDMRVDGATIEAAQVEIVRGGVSRQASTLSAQAPLEIPSNERFAVLVHNHPLAHGAHELELTAHFHGLGEIAAKIKDKLV